MAVKIGSARIDENGAAHGGKAGDQTGKEVSTQTWYLHSKGWRVFRAKSIAVAARIAIAMRAACENSKIGYDQGDRGTLYTVAKAVGFDPAKVTTPCETDCSALVRVCCAFAGVTLPNFRTPTEASALLDSGAFVELTGSKYTTSPDYLLRGDILVTRTQGHTVVVLTNGNKSGADDRPSEDYKLGERTLQKGDVGPDVKELQQDLVTLGWSFPKYGCDGDFGEETETNVKGFQRISGLEPDGIFGPATYQALVAALHQTVTITGDAVNVRKGPGLEYAILGTAHKGDKLTYGGQQREDGARVWYLVDFHNQNGWVSGKYARLG